MKYHVDIRVEIESDDLEKELKDLKDKTKKMKGKIKTFTRVTN